MTFVSFTGNICSDVRFGDTTGRDGNARKFVAFNVAVNGMKDADGNSATIFYSCITSNKGIVEGVERARAQDGSLKGKMVQVAGDMQPKPYTAKDGTQGTDYSVSITDLGFSVLFQTIGVAKAPKSEAPVATATPTPAPAAAPQATVSAPGAVDEFFDGL